MKAKVYVPIIVAAGAITGLVLGLTNMNSGNKGKISETDTQVAIETTLSEEELKKLEKEKEKEYEKKVKEEEENAKEFFKKRQEEKNKKEEEEKKKAEEEKKKKEEEEKEKAAKKESEEAAKKKEEEAKETDEAEKDDDEDDDYEYIYVPVQNSSSDQGSNSAVQNTQNNITPAPANTHVHNWVAVYKTVHHDAQTHTEKRQVGSVEYTECTYNGEPYFSLTTEYENDSFYQVCKTSDGSVVYETVNENEKKEIFDFMSMMNISPDDEAYDFKTNTEDITDDVTVTDRGAYDEKVFDYYECSGCGQKSY